MPDKNFCRLGDLSFSAADGITGFTSETGFDYAQHDLITGKQTLQAMGETLAAITITIMLRNYLGHDVPGNIDAIEKMKATGKPQKLVFGSGIYQGEYVVKSISSAVLKTDASGAIQSADMTLNLLEFADRETQTRRKTEKRPAGEKQKRTVTVVE
jgi:phage protein U